ncbi:hypothetical protein CA54_22060 [Symmachiella macrocystis]|uniref:Uncharacterized protein n=1 Tax=Symmachiella macrocystis TaxID=2527985 RepID=A0A5C6BPP7_9PLAN|nr:hypothetical protein CA54_22060 [Symmachiella macrocystis]
MRCKKLVTLQNSCNLSQVIIFIMRTRRLWRFHSSYMAA